jgi:flagellar hook-associated protein 3 FlgL
MNSIYNSSSYALYLHSKAISKLQEQYSTGSRINRASDDPSAAYQVMGLNTQSKSLGNFVSTIDDVSSVLEMSTTVIGSMQSGISNVKVSLNQIISGTYNEDGRKRLAEQVDDALDQMVSLANTKHSGKYIYGGNNTDTQPYAIEYNSDNRISKVTYQGSTEQRNVEIAPGVESSAYYVGDELFRSNERTTPVFVGDTGTKSGTGTSTVTGNVWLNVTTDADGHYNLSTGGATVDLGGLADLSNVAVKDADGKVLFVDARDISHTGYEMISVPGTYDVFNVLMSVRDLLLNGKGLSTTQIQECRNTLSNSLDEVTNQLLNGETSIGSKIGFINDLKDSLENIKYNTEDEATAIQQADIAQVSIDLARRETLYQLTLSATGKLMSMSLLDFVD